MRLKINLAAEKAREKSLLNQKLNRGAYRNSLPFLPRLIHDFSNHKKKLLALVVLSGIMIFYDWHRSLLEWTTSKSHRLLNYLNITKVQESQILRQAYWRFNRACPMGLSRFQLMEVLKRHGMLSTQTDQQSYLQRSGYHRPSNQRLSSVPYEQFEESIKELNKKGVQVQSVVEEVKELMKETKLEAQKLASQKRIILAGLPYFQKTEELLFEYLEKDPEQPFEQVKQSLRQKGVTMISVQSEIDYLMRQKKWAELLLQFEKEKAQSFLYEPDDKPSKLLQKIKSDLSQAYKTYEFAYGKDYNEK